MEAEMMPAGGSSSSSSSSSTSSSSPLTRTPDYVICFPTPYLKRVNAGKSEESTSSTTPIDDDEYQRNKADDDDDDDDGCFTKVKNIILQKEEEHQHQSTKKLKSSRAIAIQRLQQAGCEVHQILAREKDEVFVTVTVTEERVKKEADKNMVVFHKLKEEHGGMYAEFSVEKEHLFEPYSSSSFFPSGLRGYIVLHLIESPQRTGGAGLVLDHLIDDGRITRAFPLHEEETRQRLFSTWAASPFSRQPLKEIRDYFGERIALYFACLGFYTKWLIIATLLGLIPFIVGIAQQHGTGNLNWDNAGTILYCIFLSLWSTTFLEFWKRNQAAKTYHWGVIDFKNNEHNRPEFEGQSIPGVWVGNVWVDLKSERAQRALAGRRPPINKYYDMTKRNALVLVSLAVGGTSLMVVVAATVGILFIRLQLQSPSASIPVFWGGTIGGIINGVVIVILNMVYSRVADVLTDLENHRTETAYEDSLTLKIFLFQFVNSYISLTYIAFFKGNPAVSLPGDHCNPLLGCMGELSSQLLSLLITRVFINQVNDLLVPYITNKMAMNAEEKEVKKEFEGDTDGVLPMGLVEKQADMVEYPSTFVDYNDMVIQFGYVTLFAAAFPIASIIALINNFIKIRSAATKLTKETQRPEYQAADSIGSWLDVLEAISVISVMTNMLILVVTSDQIAIWFDKDDPTSIYARHAALWIVIMMEHVIFFFKYLIFQIVPDVPYWVQQELALQKVLSTIADPDVTADEGGEDKRDEFSDEDDAKQVIPDDLDTKFEQDIQG